MTHLHDDFYNHSLGAVLLKISDFTREMAEFTHFNESGRARMVDVSAKTSTERVATAQATVFMSPETLEKSNKERSPREMSWPWPKWPG